MKWSQTRFLPVSYLALLTLLVVVGCSNKQEPSETMDQCGNHTCGQLAMVTTDTASDGFHYLNPTVSPDGTRILFSADWLAIPPSPRFDEDARWTVFRQIIVMPIPDLTIDRDPETDLPSQGAMLVRMAGTATIRIGGQIFTLNNMESELRKGEPVWLDDDRIVFWCQTPRGNRLFRANNLTNICPEPECKSFPTVIYMEPEDLSPSGGIFQHMSPALSPDRNWLAYTRSGCVIPDSFETCTQLSLNVIDMRTAGINNGYGAVSFPVTSEVSRLEKPRWSPDGTQLIFAAGVDMAGETGAGTEIFTIDFDTTGLAADTMVLDNNLDRLTHTAYTEGDPISGVFNTSPAFTPDGEEVIFVSTRRAPSITLHDRNLWRMPANGNLEPEIYYFTRSDDVDPEVQADGSILFSSQLGFPTEMLNRLEEEAYLRLVIENEELESPLSEVQMRSLAADERRLLEYFQGVMSHLYFFRP